MHGQNTIMHLSVSLLPSVLRTTYMDGQMSNHYFSVSVIYLSLDTWTYFSLCSQFYLFIL